ncbi:MAG: hypothetical protein ACOYNI_00395 [Acidimicrobiia bacterium]
MSILAAAVPVPVDPLSDPAWRVAWSLALSAGGIGAGFGAIRAAKGLKVPRVAGIVGGLVALVLSMFAMGYAAYWANEYVAPGGANSADIWPWGVFLAVAFLVGAPLATAGGFAIGTAVHAEQGETTWAMAMVGAVLVFAWMLMAYAILPDAWIQFADAKLQWSRDALFYGNPNKTAIPFNITYQALRDLIAVGIYAGLGVANLVLIIQWQKRFVVKAAPAEGDVPAKRSRFGRPLFRGANG